MEFNELQIHSNVPSPKKTSDPVDVTANIDEGMLVFIVGFMGFLVMYSFMIGRL